MDLLSQYLSAVLQNAFEHSYYAGKEIVTWRCCVPCLSFNGWSVTKSGVKSFLDSGLCFCSFDYIILPLCKISTA